MSLMLRKWILNSIIKSQPVRKPIAHLSRIESLPDDSQIHGHFKLACISDKEKFIRAVFTKDSLAVFEQEGTRLDDIRGGLISLQDYAFIASVGTDRRFSEYFVEIHKFTFIGGERNMPIPTVTNINLDERVQSKLAQIWREEHLDTRTNSSALRVYSQTEDAPQLSQDELSMLLLAMSEQSQVDSIEAISSSQLFELENIPGWLKPEKDTQMEEQPMTQETEYGTPLVEVTHVTTLHSGDPSSHDTPVSDGIFITPPEGLVSPLLTDDDDLDQQQTVSGRQDQWMDDNEEPLDLTTMSPLSSTATTPPEEEAIQQMSVARVKDMSSILEQAVRNVSEMLSTSSPVSLKTPSNHTLHNNEEVSRPTCESPLLDKDVDDFSDCCDISGSQVKDLDAVWAKEESSLPVASNIATEEQPCSDYISLASDPPSNGHNCNSNNISNNGCPEQKTAVSGGQHKDDQHTDKQGQDQQVTEGDQPTDKGKGGTTKNIQVEKLYSNNIRSQYDNDLMDDDISVSSSQRDELDKLWVVVADDEVNNAMVMSSPETLDDLHPFQLTSLPDPIVNATDDEQPLVEATGNSPGPSGVVTMDSTGQETKGKVVVSENGMNLDASDRHLLSQVETVTSPDSAKAIQTSLVSTAAITRLLDISNKIPPRISSVHVVRDKTIPQSSAITSNTRMTPSRTMTSNTVKHYA